VGASDDLARGRSTFMVEMTETAAILHNATRRSLVVLDEIGRGTSTFDGVSIAWAVAEHLHDAVGCRTLFATHYHELQDLARERPAVRNLTVAVREVGDRVVFLRKLVQGGASRSYGIEVAKLAGLPPEVLARAREILANLEALEVDEGGHAALARGKRRRKLEARKARGAGLPAPLDHFTAKSALRLLVALGALLRALRLLLVALLALGVGLVLVDGLAEALDQATLLVRVARGALQRGVGLVLEGHGARLGREGDRLGGRVGGGGAGGEGDRDGGEEREERVLHFGDSPQAVERLPGRIPGATSAPL
jgi:hypothetical protein